MKKNIIKTKNVPAAIGAYSQAVIANNLIFVSGQLGIDAETGNFLGKDITLQTRGALDNLSKILKAANSSLEKVIKMNVYLTNINDFNIVNEICENTFIKDFPARCLVEVSNLPKDALIEIEVIASIE